MARVSHHGITDQSKASRHRREDARVLFHASRWRGAMYLGGYALECLLKAKLMARYECRTLKELEAELESRRLLKDKNTLYTHQLVLLLKLTGGADRLKADRELWPLFNIVNQWVPAWRYNPDLSSYEDAEDFFEALDRIQQWVENSI